MKYYPFQELYSSNNKERRLSKDMDMQIAPKKYKILLIRDLG